MQHLPDIEKTDTTDEKFCLKRTIYIGRRKVCVNYQTDTDKLNIAVYRYRSSSYLKDEQIDLKMSEYQLVLEKQVCLLSYIGKIYKLCFVLDETIVHKKNKLHQERTFSW